MTDEDIRAILVKARARKFATVVKDSVFAHFIPEETILWFQGSDELARFKAHLVLFGLQERPDHRWERRS